MKKYHTNVMEILIRLKTQVDVYLRYCISVHIMLIIFSKYKDEILLINVFSISFYYLLSIYFFPTQRWSKNNDVIPDFYDNSDEVKSIMSLRIELKISIFHIVWLQMKGPFTTLHCHRKRKTTSMMCLFDRLNRFDSVISFSTKFDHQ